MCANAVGKYRELPWSVLKIGGAHHSFPPDCELGIYGCSCSEKCAIRHGGDDLCFSSRVR